MAKRLAWAAIALMVAAAPLASHAGYNRELKKQTRSGRIYHPNTWDAEIIWRATFFDDAFREEFKKRHQKIKHLNEIGAERFEMEQANRHLNGWDFFVAIYTKDEYKNFSHYEDTFWHIELRPAGGEAVKPILVEKLPITPYEKRMFPYIDRWSQGYRVTFPKVDLGGEFDLTIKSVVGSSTLEWNMR
ncbi:MAG: hypothetical protein JXA24_07160 [Proteobacteria bacterium]|nr:hypothetical protein [Pseudomonadota bacterium]